MIGQYIVNGLLLGGLYACLAVGFSLVWGVLNVINMMHGALVVLGAYFCIYAVETLGIHLALAVPLACVSVFVIGYALQRGIINKVVGRPILFTLVLTFGLELVVYNLMLVGFGATPQSLMVSFGTVEIAGMRLPVARLVGMAAAGLLTVLLYWLLAHSRIGRAIVAVRMDRHAAALMGIRIPQIYALTFGIGAFMAAVAGCAMALIYPITPMMQGVFLGKAFVICVLGGLGSVPGAIVGGLALGMVESLADVTLGPQWATSIGFLLMMIVIIVMPSGLVGKKDYE